MEASRRRTVTTETSPGLGRSRLASSASSAISAAPMPAVTETGVATIFATAVNAVVDDGSPCPTALLLAGLHRSRAAVDLDAGSLRCFLETARHVSPTTLLRTLVLSLPQVRVSHQRDLADDEGRAIIKLAADAVVRAAIDEAKRLLPHGTDKEALIAGALRTLPSLTALADMVRDFESTCCKVVDSMATPETAQSNNVAASGRNLSLSIVYQAARSRLSLIAATLRNRGQDLKCWDAVVEIRDEAEAAALRSESEDPLTGRSALRRTMEELAWLCRPLVATAAEVSGIEPAPVRLVLVDRTPSSVVVDITRRFTNSQAALPGCVALACIVANPNGAVKPCATLGDYLRDDFKCPDGCVLRANLPDAPPDVVAFVPCGLALETIQLGLFCDALSRPKGNVPKGARTPPALAAVPDVTDSVAPRNSYESARVRCFRAVASSLLADATAVVGDGIPRVACGVFARVIVFAAENVRAQLAQTVDLSPAVAGQGVLGAPLVALILDVIASQGGKGSDAATPLGALGAPAISAASGCGAECIRSVATVSIEPASVAASADDIANCIADACGVFERQGVIPAFEASLQPPPASVPESAVASPDASPATGGGDDITQPTPASASHTAHPSPGASVGGDSDSQCEWHRRQWAAIGVLLREGGAALWAAALRDHPELIDELAAPVYGAELSGVDWLRTEGDITVTPRGNGVFVKPGNFLALPRWQEAVDQQRQQQQAAAAEAAQAAAAAAVANAKGGRR